MTKHNKETEKKKNGEVSDGKPPSEEAESQEEFPELPENMPQETKRTIHQMMMASTTAGPRHHPLFDKFTEAHVDKYLDYVQRDDDNEFRMRSSNRWFYMGYTIIGLAFFCFLLVFLLPANKTLFVEILRIIVAFAGGVGSGYGIKAFREKK